MPLLQTSTSSLRKAMRELLIKGAEKLASGNPKTKKLCIASPKLEKEIKEALLNYKKTWLSEEKIFEELCFCLLTPQSSAHRAFATIEKLKKENLLKKGSAEQKAKHMHNVRFYKTKSYRLAEAQKKFPPSKIKKILQKNGLPTNAIKCREYLLKNVKGYGLKESSHFLRNIGFGEEIAILDRHILKNLIKCGVIKKLPPSLTKKRYLEIEEKMKSFCIKNKIDFGEIDLIFWSNETGNVFK